MYCTVHTEYVLQRETLLSRRDARAESRDRICKRLRSPGIDSKELHQLMQPGLDQTHWLLKRFTNSGTANLFIVLCLHNFYMFGSLLVTIMRMKKTCECGTGSKCRLCLISLLFFSALTCLPVPIQLFNTPIKKCNNVNEMMIPFASLATFFYLFKCTNLQFFCLIGGLHKTSNEPLF